MTAAFQERKASDAMSFFRVGKKDSDNIVVMLDFWIELNEGSCSTPSHKLIHPISHASL